MAELITISYRLCQILSGVLIVLIMAVSVDGQTQGYYYTFSSLLAVQVIFDAGIVHALTTSVSHDIGSVVFKGSKLIGPTASRVRVILLFALCKKWFIYSGLLYILFATTIGELFFISVEAPNSVLLSWAIVVAVTGLQMPLNAFASLIESANYVYSIAKFRLTQAVAQSSGTILGFLSGFDIYSIAFGYLCCLFVSVTYLFFIHRGHWLAIHRSVNTHTLVRFWRAEVFPLQSRLAISWVSGFLIFNLVTPMLLKYNGAEAAGRYGMSAQILSAFFSLSSVWVNLKAPLLGMLAGKGDTVTLLKSFKSAFYNSVTVMTFGVFCIVIFVIVATDFKYLYVSKILPLYDFIVLACASYINCIISLVAVYIRAFKSDPFAMISFFQAILAVLLSFVLIPKLGMLGGALTMLIPTLFIGAVGTYYATKSFRLEYYERKPNEY